MTTPTTQISPTRPYMLRAVFEWIEDNGLTPYLMVNATLDNVQIPKEYVQDGRIILSIASQSTHNMHMGNEFINFDARFGGVSQTIWIPIQAVMGIYAKENSEKMAMFFDPNEYDGYKTDLEDGQTTPAKENVNKASDAKKAKRENKAGLKVLK